MGQRNFFLRRFAALLSVGILFSLLLLSYISTRLIVRALNTISYTILNRCLNQGETILNRYLDGEINDRDLTVILNPELNLNLTFLVLVGADGHTIAASSSAADYVVQADLETQAAGLQTQMQFVAAGRSRSDRIGLLLGRPVYRAGTRVGSVFAGLVTTETLAARSEFNLNIFTVIWPLFLLILLVSLLAANRFTRPIRVLADATRRIAGGKWGTVINDQLPGEMGSLAADFNAMSVSLAGTIDSLNYEKNSMKLMLEGLQEGIVAVDSTGRVLHQNGAALKLLHGTASPNYRQVLQALTACVGSGESFTGRLAVREGLVEYVIRRIPAGSGDDRQGTGAIALLRDITVSERLEQTRREYVANISHELRTPLTAMRGLIEPLKDGLVQDEAERRRCYETIAAESLRLSRLVNDLLELSGIQTHAVAFETEDIDTADLMQDVYYRNRQLFDAAGLTFVLQMPEGLPAVRTNEDRIIQVLTILLDNARKYTPAGGRVVLDAESGAAEVRISVRDTGIGMDEDVREHIFERFYQGDQSRRDRGNGLGLAIANEILTKLSIPLTLDSVPGHGSVFTLALPLAALPGDQPAAAAPADP